MQNFSKAMLPKYCPATVLEFLDPSVTHSFPFTDKRASKMKLTYCYGLQPFLVQFCLRHPGEKDTGKERKYTLQSPRETELHATEYLQRKLCSCVVVKHFWRHCRLAHGRIILGTGPVPACLSSSCTANCISLLLLCAVAVTQAMYVL